MVRDDIYEYSLDAHHSEEEGRKIRKKILFVTVLLTVITTVEVMLGAFIKQDWGIYWTITKWFFIALTLVKAGYIVLTFMHLGDERKGLRAVILVPYFIFILYLIFILLWEGTSVHHIWTGA